MNDKVLRLLRNPLFLPITVGVVSFGTGVGVGFLLGRRNKFESYDDPTQLNFDLRTSNLRTEEQLDGDHLLAEADLRIKEYHERVEREEREAREERDPDNIATPAEDFILQHLGGTVVLEDEPGPHPIEAVAQSIFGGPIDDWDYEKELKQRSPLHPYVLHRDEFYADEMGYEQTTMTYYAGDDIMADQEDSPVYNHSIVVGPLLFGHGSGDPNVFHVRNDQRREEYEIVFDEGHFSVEVMGLEIENNERVKNLRHDRYKKFRPE